MKSLVVASLVAAVAAAPKASPRAYCAASADGKFTITTVMANGTPSKRGLHLRQLSGILTMSLKDGVLTDQAGRIGYIASNYQFQFDAPVQGNALEDAGFGLCSDGFLSLKGSTLFYQCKSGDFYNLYSESIGGQCIAIHIQAINNGQGPGVTQISDGQPQASAPASAPAVSQISDGQPQASAPAPAVTQISDGQPQVTAPPSPAVSQISDGQPQITAPPAPPVSQISDGQPQVTGPPAPPVSQISDGQPQVTGPPAPPVSQISDGQPQVTGPPAPAVTQISDGQPQVTVPPASSPENNHTANVTNPSIPEYTGAAATTITSIGALTVGFFAVLSFL